MQQVRIKYYCANYPARFALSENEHHIATRERDTVPRVGDHIELRCSQEHGPVNINASIGAPGSLRAVADSKYRTFRVIEVLWTERFNGVEIRVESAQLW